MFVPELDLVVRWEDHDFELSLEPLNGLWTSEQFIRLSAQTNRLVEFVNGTLEFIPTATMEHQGILGFLLGLFHDFMAPRGGRVMFAAFHMKINDNLFRAPDIQILLDAKDPRSHEYYWECADFVLEIVNPNDPERDLQTKRQDYAMARIPEYWIVYPAQQEITVLRLDGDHYVEHGVFGRGEVVTSVLLPEISVEVNAILDAD